MVHNYFKIYWVTKSNSKIIKTEKRYNNKNIYNKKKLILPTDDSIVAFFKELSTCLIIL